MNKKEANKFIRKNFEAINNVDNSSKKPKMHIAMHKLYDYARITNGRYQEMGVLQNIESEKVYHNLDCGNPFEIVLPNGENVRGIPEKGDLRIDSFEEFLNKDDEIVTRNIEVLVNHPQNAYFQHNKEGKKIAEDFCHYMTKRGYFNEINKKRFLNGVKNFLYINGTKRLCRLHYHISDTHPLEEIDYGPFKGIVEVESELERNWRLYNGLADEMVFVLLEKNLGSYIADYVKLLEKYKMKHKDTNISYFVTIPKPGLEKIFKGYEYLWRQKKQNIFDKGKNKKRRKNVKGIDLVSSACNTLHIPPKLQGKILMPILPVEKLVPS